MSFPAQWQGGLASFAYVFRVFQPAVRVGSNSVIQLVAPPDKKIYVVRAFIYFGPDILLAPTVVIDNDLVELNFPGGDRDGVLIAEGTARTGTVTNYIPQPRDFQVGTQSEREPLTDNVTRGFEDFSPPTPFVIPETTDYAIVASEQNRVLRIGIGWFEQR